MSEEIRDIAERSEEEIEPGLVEVPLSVSLSMAGVVFAGVSLIDLFAQWGSTGIVIALILAGLAHYRGASLVMSATPYLPEGMRPATRRVDADSEPSNAKRSDAGSVVQRLFGITPAPVEEPKTKDALPEHLQDVDPDVQSLSDEEAEEVYAAWNREPPAAPYAPLPHAEPAPRASQTIEGSRAAPSPRWVSVRAANPEREILLADSLGLDIEQVLESGLFICGMRGSGKSTLAARFIEQMSRYPLIQIIFDIKGDYVSLVHEGYFQNGIIMTKQEQLSIKRIFARQMQVVVDLRTWASLEEQTNVIANFTRGLLEHAMHLPQEWIVPWLYHLDEAQQFVPQTKPEGIETATWRASKAAVANLGFLGRSFGAVPCLYTQRIAPIHKDVISQLGLLIFMKASIDVDLERYAEYVRPQTATAEQIRGFGKGDGVAVLPDGQQGIFHFHNRQSRHGSHTPRLEDALRVSQARQARQYATVAIPEQTGNLSRILPPLAPRPTVSASVPALMPAPVPPPVPVVIEPEALIEAIEDEQLREGVRAYRGGWKSIDKLAARLGITPNAARHLQPKVLLWLQEHHLQ